jgi:hypothetical protein
MTSGQADSGQLEAWPLVIFFLSNNNDVIHEYKNAWPQSP